MATKRLTCIHSLSFYSCLHRWGSVAHGPVVRQNFSRKTKLTWKRFLAAYLMLCINVFLYNLFCSFHCTCIRSIVTTVSSLTVISPVFTHLSRLMTKPTKWLCAQRSPVWSESSLCAQWVAKDPSFLHVNSEDSYQTGRMPRLIWVFAGRTATLFVLSWGGSFTELLMPFEPPHDKTNKMTVRSMGS